MNDSLTKLQQAAAFAARAHHGQLRKDGRTPYFSHPIRVCLIVSELFGCHDLDVMAAAILHDTIEDTTTDYDDLIAVFGRHVSDWVAVLSKDKRLPEDRREETYLRDIANSPWQIQIIKLADIFDNLSDINQLAADRRPATLARMRQCLAQIGSALRPEVSHAYQIVSRAMEHVTNH